MNPQSPMTNNNRSEQPYSPTPIIGHKSWSERFSVKKMLPNLVISAILINVIPELVIVLYEPFKQYKDVVTGILNAIWIFAFLVVIILQIKDSPSAKS